MEMNETNYELRESLMQKEGVSTVAAATILSNLKMSKEIDCSQKVVLEISKVELKEELMSEETKLGLTNKANKLNIDMNVMINESGDISFSTASVGESNHIIKAYFENSPEIFSEVPLVIHIEENPDAKILVEESKCLKESCQP